MELQNFIQNIVDLFDDIDTSNFSALTDLKIMMSGIRYWHYL